jgi:hypothetical protein
LKRATAPLLASLLTLFALAPHAPLLAAETHHSYLILPFEDSAPDGARDWLQEAMALSIGDYFLTAGHAVIDREDRLAVMDAMDLPVGAPLTLATSLSLGKRFRSEQQRPAPDRLVVGKFSLDNGQLSISARVLRLDADAAAPWKDDSGSLKDLLKLQKSLAHSLLRSDGVATGNLGSHDDADAGHDFPLVAYENYVRGMIDPSASKQAAFLRKAVQQSPGYPKACFQLARILARGGKRTEAEAALKGISGEPVPYVAEYHSLLGELAMDAGRLTEAEAEARASLSARETPEAHLLLARIARSRSDSAQALKELDRAESLDPDNPDIDSLRRQLRKDPPPHP